MKHLVAVLGLFAMIFIGAHNSAYAKPLDKPEPNWFEQIFQTLTGSQPSSTSSEVNSDSHVIPRHHHTKYKKHRNSHHAHTSTQRASAKDTKSRAHTKLFEEFQEWYNMQQLYKLYNPIQHGSPQ